MTLLHCLGNGSEVKIIKASELVKILVWKGNRNIDPAHVAAIKNSVEDVKTLDFGYRLVTYDSIDGGGNPIEETVLVDGQHRHAVLSEYFKESLFTDIYDFPVVVTIKNVESESDIIEYFNALNHVKPIKWDDPELIVNNYIQALEKRFNTNKTKPLFRKDATGRPYLSILKVREELRKHELRGSKHAISTFIQNVVKWNEGRLKMADALTAFGDKFADYLERAASVKFMLAVDPKLSWIRECL